MKHFILILACSFSFIVGCKEENDKDIVNKACEIENPTENIEWLKELVAKSATDTTGNYKGTIYLEKFNGEDVIFVDMAMGSGGLYGYWYNCDGTPLSIGDTTLIPKRELIIYKNIEL